MSGGTNHQEDEASGASDEEGRAAGVVRHFPREDGLHVRPLLSWITEKGLATSISALTAHDVASHTGDEVHPIWASVLRRNDVALKHACLERGLPS